MSANGTLSPSRIGQSRSPGATRSSPELWSRRRWLRMAWTPSAKQRKCRTKICFWLVLAQWTWRISPTKCRAVYEHTRYEHPSFWWKTAEASCFCQRCSFRKGTGTIWLQNPWRTQRIPNKKIISSKSKHAYYSSFDDTVCVHTIHTLRLWRRVSASFQTSILEGRCPGALQNKFRHCRDRGIVEDQSHRQLNTRQRLRELLENGKAGMSVDAWGVDKK